MKTNEDKDSYFSLFSNCIPVKGAARSVIVDLQREEMFFISNELLDILIEPAVRKWSDILSDYDEESQHFIEEYLDFLVANELGFWTDNPGAFPKMNLEWDTPSVITNAIIDSDASSHHNWGDIFDQLEELGCKDLQLRFFDKVPPAELSRILDLLENRRIRSAEIILKHSEEYTKRLLKKLTDKYFRIKTITLHSSPDDEVFVVYKNSNRCGMGNIIFVKQPVDSAVHCGIINAAAFTMPDVNAFSEFKSFNSCLNRKVGIDVRGAIRNCPSMANEYGNIADVRIADVLTDEFKGIWRISKEQIETCNVCEFRYVCTDCRAYIQDDRNLLSKPAKCGYDPYTMKWN